MLRPDREAALQAEIDRLQDKIEWLESTLGVAVEQPLGFGLTTSENRLLGIFEKNGLVTKSNALAGMYFERPDREPDMKIIDVFVCKLRKKLEKQGIKIETVWGQGYMMPAESKALLKRMREEQKAVAA